MAILTIDHASKIYGTDVQVRAVNDPSMNMEEGEFVAIMGASGSGKSRCSTSYPASFLSARARFASTGAAYPA